MKKNWNRLILADSRLILAAFILSVVAATGHAQVFERQLFDTDIAALVANPNRLPGREDGSRAASYYVEKRLREMGMQEIYIQEFPVVMPRMTQCELEANGRRYPMHAIAPNLLQASVTPAEGLTGQSLYVGKGTPAEYQSARADGKIVFMDYDSDKEWIHAFSFGAIAVVFIGNDDVIAQPYHSINISANLPRFYISEELAAELGIRSEPRDISLFAACSWELLEGRNVIGVVRGSSPRGNDNLDQAVVLAAAIDSYSEVPELSSGARDAANVAVLLQTAKHFLANKPQRDVVFAFFDAQSQNHAGATAYYGSLYRRLKSRKIATQTLEERLSMLSEERNDVSAVADLLGTEGFPKGVDEKNPRLADARRTLISQIRGLSYRPMEQLKDLRLYERELGHKLKQLDKDSPEATEITITLENLRSRNSTVLGQIEILEIEDLAWNTLLRVMNEKADIEDESVLAAHAAKVIDHEDEIKREVKRRRFVSMMQELFDEALRSAIDASRHRAAEIDVQTKHVNQDIEIRNALGSEKSKTVLHVHANFGDASTKWSFIHGDYTTRLHTGDGEGFYGSIYRAMREINSEIALNSFDERPISLLYSSRMFVPTIFADSSAMARVFGRFNLSAMTIMDGLSRQGTPTDTLKHLNVDNVFRQGGDFAIFMHAVSGSSGLDRDHPTGIGRVNYLEAEYSRGNPSGNIIRQADSGDPMRSAAVAKAVVAIQNAASANISGAQNSNPNSQQILMFGSEGVAPGFNPTSLVMSRSNGIFEYGPTQALNPLIFIAAFDETMVTPEDGIASRGIISSVSVPGIIGTSFPIVKGRGLTLVGNGFHRGPVTTTSMEAASTAAFRPDRYFQLEAGPVMVLFAPYDKKETKLFNRQGIALLNNENNNESYQGKGVPLDDPFARHVVARSTARDLWTLNEYRLAKLRANHIGQESLEILQGRAADILDDAYAPEVESTSKYFGMLEASASFSRRVYSPLVGVFNDLVTAVVLLLLLAIPFAFALERLLIGTPHIYRQIGWFAIMFLLTFTILFLVNPAFKLAATPIIIFLAFTIILLSSLVIFIMLRKLEAEMQKLKGLSASAHSADVSRVSTMMAAVKMGISTMRRRPIRTVLTATTVTLLTFTILTFASFGSSWGNLKTYRGTLTPPPRVMVRYPFWTPIVTGQVTALTGYLEGRAMVVPRYWIAPLSSAVQEANTNGVSLDMLVSTEDTSQICRVSAALGLFPTDLQQQESLANTAFVPGARLDLLDSDGIFLTRAVADLLKLSEADIGVTPLLFRARTLTFAGFIADDLSNQRMLDGSSILPVDYAASASGDNAALVGPQQVTADSDSMQFISFSLDSVVVVGGDMARKLGGEVRALTIYAHDHAELEAIADEVAMITEIPTYLGSRGGVYRLFFSTLIEASGFRDLIIPIVLGGLIIFATMLGSVSDREREIYTFSSLGLGPAHVAGLFFAEASVYAVVGGMGGYLLGQVVAQVLGFAASYTGFAVPSMNFSSTNAIVTIFIVMCTVLLSTIYPAVKASRSANPGIQRNWKIGDPVGDVYDLVFPFTVSAYDLTGVVSFLEEHFNNYKDAAVGAFMTLRCEPIRQAGSDSLGLRTQIALAPFDLGIEQTLIMLSQPSDVEGINEVRIIMKRHSGAYNDWRRANRVFVNDMRKQFLIWRSIDTEITEKYREMTLARLNNIRIIDSQELIGRDDTQDWELLRDSGEAAAVAGNGDFE